MPQCRSLNFDITISGDAPPYALTASYAGQSAQASFSESIHDRFWQETLTRLADPRQSPGEALLVEVGSRLFDALLDDEVRDLWITARSELAAQPDLGLCLRLLLHPPAVNALPWESLYEPRQQRPLGADARIALVRRANRVGYVDRPRPLKAELPLKILVAAVDDPFATVSTGERMDPARELDGITAWLAPLQPHKIQLTTLSGRLDIHTLRRRLEAEQPDIFHLISHGEPDGLLLWSPNGEPALISGGPIAALLRPLPSLKLVFLNACLAGQPDGNVPFGGVAHRLLQSGLPAVIAMQFEITDSAAVDFAGFLYEALVAGDCPGAVDRAVSRARSYLLMSNPERLDFITPVLWLNTDDGIIAHFAPAQKHPTLPLPSDSLPLDQLPRSHIELHIDEKMAWFNRLPVTINNAFMRFDYESRRRNLERLLTLLHADADAQAQGETLNASKIATRLEVFTQERNYLENLLRTLPPASP